MNQTKNLFVEQTNRRNGCVILSKFNSGDKQIVEW